MFIKYEKTPLRVAKAALLFAFVVVMLGAYTRLNDAGLGCPDWPGCYGFVIVPQSQSEVATAQALFPNAPVEQDKAWIEMIHRYCAGFLGMMILYLTILAWRRRHYANVPIKLSFFILLMVVFQALLGMWTVTLNLLPVVVVAHLLGGMTIVALLFCLIKAWQGEHLKTRISIPKKIKKIGLFALLVLFIQIFLGGWTSANYATWACADFPTCHGQWIPDLKLAEALDFSHPVGPNYSGGVLSHPVRVSIHWLHRLGALLSFLVLGYLSFLLLFRQHGAVFRRYGLKIGILLCVQVLLGIGNIVLHFPLWNAVLHNAMAALLLMSLVGLNFKMYYARDQYTYN